MKQTTNDDYLVRFVTRVYVDKIVNVNQRFGAIAESNYNSDVISLDFGDSRAAAKDINEWIKESTNGRISDLVSEDTVSNSVLFLINALYFESSWRYPFNKTLTRDFIHSPGKKSSRQFMEQTNNFYYFFSRQLNAKILRLPYRGRTFSMFMILPIEVNGLDSVIEKLNAETLNNEVSHMKELETLVVIPKFKFDTLVNLNDVTRSVREI
jgi:serine protease inhibitor